MKKKIIGLLIFLFFIVVPFILEDGNILALILPSALLVVFGPAAGLLVASLKKGQSKAEILKKAKKYLLYSGFLGTLLAFIGIFATLPASVSVSDIFHKLSLGLSPILLGSISAFIVDTFIE
jgi:hypothetical protein